MLRLLIIFSCLFVLKASALITVNPGPAHPPTKGEVWPKPNYEIRSVTYYTYNPSNFKIKIINETCDILTSAIERYSDIIENNDIRRRGSDELHSPRRRQNNDDGEVLYQGSLQELRILLTAPCEQYPYLGMNEQYELNVSIVSTLESASIWGILRGLETFSQKFYMSEDMTELRIFASQVIDYPQYSHRGLMLDTSRHYISLANIFTTLDAMAMNKMNVFHWHIVDDQSFPYQSEKFPDLSAKGAYHPTMVYTKDDIQRVVEYARIRGIRVIPEFDVPGHTRSWGNAYPNILTECYRGNTIVGLGPMHPLKNTTYKLIRNLFQEVQSWFPDKYLHVGGDEVELDCWASNPEIKEYLKENNLQVEGLHAMFMRKIMPLLANNSNAIVWQEVFDEGVPLSKDTVVQVWKYEWTEEMVNVLQAGHRVLYSSEWYLDNLRNEWPTFYKVDPRQIVAHVIQNASLLNNIVGGEACMWSEMVDDRNVISRVWPRASAVAEKLWSVESRRKLRGHLRTYRTEIPEYVYNRMEEHVCRMIHRGINAQPASGPGFCLS